jgi:hypothetical protein
LFNTTNCTILVGDFYAPLRITGLQTGWKQRFEPMTTPESGTWKRLSH